MIGRCSANYFESHLYFYKGITVCERWKTFENFLTDMGERPPGTTIDRYPNGDGNYEKSNCRWATAKEQGRNRCNLKLSKEIVAEIRQLEGTASLGVIGKRYGVTKQTICKILKGTIWA